MRCPGVAVAAVALLHADTGAECAACHPKEVAGYNQTAMAKSLTRAAEQPDGRFEHRLSGTKFTMTGSRQVIERGGYKAEYAADYVMGSGNHAFAYLVRIGEYMFQSPVSYYTRRKVWDVAPGYESADEPDFTRPITAECVLCHVGQARTVAGSLNRFADPPFAVEAISCDRCHGSAADHLRMPSKTNIKNPARMPVRARASVCEQCHLGGEARIPHPGRRIAEFTAGEELERVFSVYVPDQPENRGLKVVSHVEQLALSLCERRSEGGLWCGTCHNPHDPPTEAGAAAYYEAKCRQCHAAPSASVHSSKTTDCAGCHMPKRRARDGGHTAFTDHRITRRGVEEPGRASSALRAWREPPRQFAERNLGLAYVVAGERDESVAQLDRGYRLLSVAYDRFRNDPAVLTSLAFVLLRKGRPEEAVKLYRRAADIEPGYAPYRANLGKALEAAGQTGGAIRELERALELDPSLEPVYRGLAALQIRRGDREKARETLVRLLRFMPGNIFARMARDRPR